MCRLWFFPTTTDPPGRPRSNRCFCVVACVDSLLHRLGDEARLSTLWLSTDLPTLFLVYHSIGISTPKARVFSIVSGWQAI